MITANGVWQPSCIYGCLYDAVKFHESATMRISSIFGVGIKADYGKMSVTGSEKKLKIIFS
jgi:hypothetical protein